MKKIITLLLLVFIFLGNTQAFSISQFEEKKADYKMILENRLGDKLGSLNEKTLDKLQITIKNKVKLIENNTSISDSNKVINLSIYYALIDFIEDIKAGKKSGISEKINILVIDDKRCTNCQTDNFLIQLKQISTLSGANFEKKDFSDKGVKEYLKENNIQTLPALIFENNQIDESINPYLLEIPSKEYSLQIGATFNPFVERSEKGFLILDKEKLDKIKNNSYIRGNKNAKITWIEYSDLECPYCAKLHIDGTPTDLKEKYGQDLNKIFNHFPLDFHKNAQTGAEILECVGEQKGSEAFYEIIYKSYNDRDYTKSSENSKYSSKVFLLEEAEKLGIKKEKIEKCLEDNKYKEKVESIQKIGIEYFNITGTPGNVLINNETFEFEVISGAYPKENFEEIIDKLLK